MPHVELPQAEFKVVMLGETFTGKTSLVLRFAEGYYRDSARNPTVGAFFITKRLTVNGMTAKIQIWDTAGQEQFKRLAPMYYKNAAAAIICYDVTSPKSFETLEYWMNELQQNIPAGGIVIAMCATKCDLSMNPDTSQVEALAARTGSIFLTTSAKTNTNVNLLFQKVTERVLDYQRRNQGLDIPVTLGTTSVETNTLQQQQQQNLVANTNSSQPLSPTAPILVGSNGSNAAGENKYSSSPSLANGSRVGNQPLSSGQEGDAIRSPVDGKRQRPGEGEEIDMLDPAKAPSGDSSKDAQNMSRCDPHNMLMCGDVVGASENGKGCNIQ